jgi:hypothetical protein
VAHGFLLCVTAKDERDQSPRRWTNVKQRLALCRIMQDGGDEGVCTLIGYGAHRMRRTASKRSYGPYSPKP